MERQDRELLISGPAGTGKSRACLEKLHHVALGVPGVRLLMLRKTLVSLTSTGLVTFREQVAAASIERGETRWFGGSMQEPAAYRYSNGSVLVVGGMDKATKIMSSEYDMIYVQEAIELTLNDWEALTTRLRYGRLPYQQLIADTNPDTPTHWLNQRCNDGATRMLESRHTDNPRLFDDNGELTSFGADYMAALDSLTGVRKDRLRHGRWVAAEGMIYEGFDPAIHVVEKMHIPNDWPRFWAVDFGFNNPMVVQRWAQDPDGALILYAEHYQTKTLVEDLAEELKTKILTREPKPKWVVCDHDAEDRATFERHTGLSTTAANKKVSEGLQAVASRLKVAGGTGAGRLVIVGGPRRGKSTLSATYMARGVPVYCGDPLSKVKDPLPGVNYLPEGLDFAGDNGGAAWVAENWFSMSGPWVCEGQVMARALRRWADSNPTGFPCDQITVLSEARAPTSAGQETMHKGVMTVWREISPRFAPVVGKQAGDGKPRLVFVRDAVAKRDQSLIDARKPASTIEELPGYVWADKKTKEEPLKQDDHGADAMRYMVAQVDLGARPRLRWVG